MRITASSLKIIAEELTSKIVNNHISNITVINSHDLFLSFSMCRKEKLLVSLNPNNPLVSLITIDNPVGTKVGALSDTLRKELKDAYILGITTINNDRILEIDFVKTNDYFEKEKKKIIIELIPHRPNLILLNENNKIFYATHYTDALNEHPVMRNLIYKEPENNNDFVEEKSFNLVKFKNEVEKYYNTAVHKRLEEQFKPVLQHIKSRIKTLKKKITVLDKEIETAKDNLKSQEIGQMILTYANDEESLLEYIKENEIDYNQSLTPGVNANKYFAKYKKAKRTLEIDKKEQEKTIDEIAYLESCLVQSKFMDEEDIIELTELLFPNKFKMGNNKKKIEAKPGELTVDGVKIYFGKNAKQNDYLTFKKAHKDHYFFHIKDVHGSHVIVGNNKPNKEIILTACELALLLSQKECGDVQCTQVKNIKKGSFLGQALLTSYETYTINSIREETKKLLKL